MLTLILILSLLSPWTNSGDNHDSDIQEILLNEANQKCIFVWQYYGDHPSMEANKVYAQIATMYRVEVNICPHCGLYKSVRYNQDGYIGIKWDYCGACLEDWWIEARQEAEDYFKQSEIISEENKIKENV